MKPRPGTVTRRSLIGGAMAATGTAAFLDGPADQARATSRPHLAASGPDDFRVSDYGAVGDGTTDDTAAIQRAIDAAYAHAAAGPGFGRVVFDAKTYALTSAPSRPVPGSLQAAGQLLIPSRTTGPMVQLELAGAGTQQGKQDAGDAPQTGGTLLESTATATWGGHSTGLPPAVIASPKGNDWSYFNRATVSIQGIAISVPPNPTLAGLNLFWAPQVRLQSVRVATTDPVLAMTEPTNTWATGIALPYVGNNAVAYVRDVHISGFWAGIVFSEHTDASSLLVFGCKVALAPVGKVAHTARFGLVSAEWCPTFISQIDWETGRIASTGDRLVMNLLDIEEFNGAGSSTWAALQYHVYDPDNLYHGWIWMARSSTSIPLTLAGAAHLNIQQLHLT